MTACLYCRMSGRKISRIPDDLRDKCLKNRNGTCPACNSLTIIDRKIDEARRTLEVLLDERETFTSLLNEHHDPIVQGLPLEVISHIFVFLKPPTPSADILEASYNEKDLIKAVFTPGHVCRGWRHIAQSTPKLWTTLCTTITQSNSIPSIAMVQDWLERSGGLPLLLQIRIPLFPNSLVYETARKVIASTIVHAQRWQVLDLEAPSELLPWMSESLLDSNLQHLHHIKGNFSEDTDVLRLSATPHRLTMNSDLSQISVNYAQITHVCLSVLYVEDAKKLFRDASHLLSCTCEQLIPDLSGTEGTSSSSPVLASSLRTLRAGGALAEVWDHFKFPSLETLGISWPNHEDDGEQFWLNLAALLRRSGCRVRELEIKDHFECHDAILEVLKVNPNLERLSLEGGILLGPSLSILDAAITSMKLEDPISGFLGKLQSLSCTTYGKSYDWLPLIGFLSGMTSKSKPSLRTFSFCYKHSAAETLGRDVLKPLLDAIHGLEVKIYSTNHDDLLEMARTECNM